MVYQTQKHCSNRLNYVSNDDKKHATTYDVRRNDNNKKASAIKGAATPASAMKKGHDNDIHSYDVSYNVYTH